MKRGMITIIIILLALLPFISAFEFNGTTIDNNGNALNNTLINISIYDLSGGFTYIGSNISYSNNTGWFNVTVTENNNWLYSPQITYTNNSIVEYIGQSLPYFPSRVLEDISGINFYLKEAGTIYLRAINATGSQTNFTYQIKDQKLGYAIAENLGDNNNVEEATIYVPKNRNYSIMIFPEQSMPVSFGFNNFTSVGSYTFDSGNSNYNATTKTLNKTFNMTMSHARVNGYIESNNHYSWNEITAIPYMLESGDMVHSTHGIIPYNLSSFFDGTTDYYNLSTGNTNFSGFYNISLPSTAETSSMMLLIIARNQTNYYGGFNNLSLDYNTYKNGADYELNFTNMFPLLGNEGNITMEGAAGPGKNVSVKLVTFNIQNSTNESIENLDAHIEAKMDYSTYGVKEFTWMADINEGSNSTFNLLLLNYTGIEEMNIFAGGGQYEPIRKEYTVTEINTNTNITLTSFNPRDIDGGSAAAEIFVSFYKSNSTCDVPNPDNTCIFGAGEDMESFDPKSAVFGGGDISFRMGLKNSGIEVHYVNVDMLASGPPAALFDDSAATTTSGGFESAARFGSNGPTIYDYVLVSIPYTEGSSSTTGLNETEEVNLSIPLFYDEDWNIIWNTSINGTTGSALGGNISHYETYQNQWETLMIGTTCTENVSLFNTTNPCYINKTANKVWIRLPHFSGSSPSITGNVVTATTTTTSSGSSGGGGGSGRVFSVSSEEFNEGIKRSLRKNDKYRFTINNEYHFITINDIGKTSIKITLASEPQEFTLFIGDTKKADTDKDGNYDIEMTLHNISQTTAELEIKKIDEEIKTTKTETTKEETKETTKEKIIEKIEEKKNTWIFIILIIVIIGVIIYSLKEKIIDKIKK